MARFLCYCRICIQSPRAPYTECCDQVSSKALAYRRLRRSKYCWNALVSRAFRSSRRPIPHNLYPPSLFEVWKHLSRQRNDPNAPRIFTLLTRSSQSQSRDRHALDSEPYCSCNIRERWRTCPSMGSCWDSSDLGWISFDSDRSCCDLLHHRTSLLSFAGSGIIRIVVFIYIWINRQIIARIRSQVVLPPLGEDHQELSCRLWNRSSTEVDSLPCHSALPNPSVAQWLVLALEIKRHSL